MASGGVIMDLASYCHELNEASVEAGKWVERNAELVRNEKEGLLKELRRAGRLFRGCERAAKRKMCAGVFGPSQAGKSYLISALARGEDNELMAVFGQEQHDFISEINPEGGKESTGLVTRFTMTRPKNVPAEYPVQVRLLSEMDLVKIIANTYYADCEHKEEAQSDIIATLNRLKKRAKDENGEVDLDDMEDLREYLVKDFRSKARVQELERSYWSEAFALAPRLDLEGRVQLYALIWDEVEEFTLLLRKLLEALAKLNYAEDLYCAMDALIPRDASIIDVATLVGLEEGSSSELRVKTPGGVETTLPRAVVTALTAELTIVMRDQPADYFEHTDLLDFPGYRSRYKLDDVRRELKKPGMLKELFLRGKVAYLFQRYCAERELNSMLLCIGPSNQEVQDLPGVINDWVCATHGEKPEDRVGQDVSLFFILTKFDMEFEEKAGAPSVETRWDNRLHASLLDFFGKQHDWPTQWTPTSGFNNLFLLRNPNFKFKSVLNYDGDIETGIRPESQNLVDKLHASFEKSDAVARHFHDPATAWNEAMRLNDGGITYIRQSLSPTCNPEIKERQLLQNINSTRAALRRRLDGFYKSDDRDELRKQKMRLVATLFQRLGQLEKKYHRLGRLLQDFSVTDAEIYDMRAEAMRRFRELREKEKEAEPENIPEIAPDFDNVDEINLGAFNVLDDEGEVAPVIAEEEPEDIQDEAGFFASYVESKWVERLHSLADDPDMQKYFFLPAQEFSALASELATGAERMGFREKMSQAFRKAASYADAHRESIVNKQAAIAARIINNYVDWMGFNPQTQNERERTVTLPGAKSAVVFQPHEPIGAVPQLEERDKQPDLPYVKRWFSDWLTSMGALILDNVNFDGQQTFNVAENAALGAIIRKFNTEAATGEKAGEGEKVHEG